MDNLVDQLILVEGEGEVKFFNGNYTDYRIALENKEDEPAAKQSPVKAPSTAAPSTAAPAASKGPKLSFKEQKEFEELEKEMAILEIEKGSLVEKLNQGSDDFQMLTDWAKAIEDIKNKLEEKELRWLELSERA
jgi:ATP-binding cassette subfamily F protein uup